MVQPIIPQNMPAWFAFHLIHAGNNDQCKHPLQTDTLALNGENPRLQPSRKKPGSTQCLGKVPNQWCRQPLTSNLLMPKYAKLSLPVINYASWGQLNSLCHSSDHFSSCEFSNSPNKPTIWYQLRVHAIPWSGTLVMRIFITKLLFLH